MISLFIQSLRKRISVAQGLMRSSGKQAFQDTYVYDCLYPLLSEVEGTSIHTKNYGAYSYGVFLKAFFFFHLRLSFMHYYEVLNYPLYTRFLIHISRPGGSSEDPEPWGPFLNFKCLNINFVNNPEHIISNYLIRIWIFYSFFFLNVCMQLLKLFFCFFVCFFFSLSIIDIEKLNCGPKKYSGRKHVYALIYLIFVNAIRNRQNLLSRLLEVTLAGNVLSSLIYTHYYRMHCILSESVYLELQDFCWSTFIFW